MFFYSFYEFLQSEQEKREWYKMIVFLLLLLSRV